MFKKLVIAPLAGTILSAWRSKPMQNLRKSTSQNLSNLSASKRQKKNAGSAVVKNQECASVENRDKFIDAFFETLSSDVTVFEGGSNREHRTRLGFLLRDQPEVFRAISIAIRRLDFYASLYPFNVSLGLDGEDDIQAIAGSCQWFDMRVREAGGATMRVVNQYYSVVEFDFWSPSELTYKASSTLETKRVNECVFPLDAGVFEKEIEARQDARPVKLDEIIEPSKSMSQSMDIDVVYTWVDDRDHEWLERKRTAQEELGFDVASLNAQRAFLDERFENRDELKYSMRSLELFAPFVRNIYIVTAGQIPEWLNLEHPKVKVVFHSDLYKHSEALPTFNSSSIETQLHRIEGLSENFLYLNDDFFFGKICESSDFFYKNGISRFVASNSRVSEWSIPDDAEEYILADRNALALFREHLDFRANELLVHAPYAAKRSVLYEMEALFEKNFKLCELSQFRGEQDLRPIAFMYPHYAYNSGKAVPGNISNRYLALWKPTIQQQFDGVLKTRKYKTFCINDVGVDEKRRHDVNQMVSRFLEDYFPMKSSFEK